MPSKLNESTIKMIDQTLHEKFGTPIVRVMTETSDNVRLCENCGCMPELDQDCCQGCGMMDETLSPDDVELSKGKKNVDDDDPLAVKDVLGRVVSKWQGKTVAQKKSEPKKVSDR